MLVYRAGMDSRTARRTAEKAARDLIASRAALVGELGVAHANRTQLADDISVATARGRQLLAAAEAEAARVLAAAHDLAHDGETRYADVYSAATAAGWTPADLSALGFPPSSTSTQRRRRTPAAPSQPAPRPAVLPEQTGAPLGVDPAAGH